MSRYVVMAIVRDPCAFAPRRPEWVPGVIGVVPRRHGVLVLWGPTFKTMTSTSGIEVGDPHVEEVADNDPLLLGPFVEMSTRGVQHYATRHEAECNLERLLALAAKKDPSLRSSVVERPLRKREVQGSNPCGGSKWIRRQQYMQAKNLARLQQLAAEGVEWAIHKLASRPAPEET